MLKHCIYDSSNKDTWHQHSVYNHKFKLELKFNVNLLSINFKSQFQDKEFLKPMQEHKVRHLTHKRLQYYTNCIPVGILLDM